MLLNEGNSHILFLPKLLWIFVDIYCLFWAMFFYFDQVETLKVKSKIKLVWSALTHSVRNPMLNNWPHIRSRRSVSKGNGKLKADDKLLIGRENVVGMTSANQGLLLASELYL